MTKKSRPASCMAASSGQAARGRAVPAGVSLAMLMCGSAVAQPATPPAPAHSGTKLEEVVVTATRRSKLLQSTPISITAVTGKQLADRQIVNVTGLERTTPSIKFTQQNNAAESADIIIRGIGTVGEQRAFEGSVGTFVDGVYRSRSGEALTQFLDMDSVQVLKGPQGTLFGKSTTAGAIILTSAAPDFSKFGGSYEVGAGSYGSRDARLTVNAPLNDKVAVRLAGLYSDFDGYFTNYKTDKNYDGSHPRALKGTIEYKPNDEFTFKLIGDVSVEREDCCYGAVLLSPGPVQPLIDALAIAGGYGPEPTNPYKFENAENGKPDQQITDRGIVLQSTWYTPWGGTLRSISAIRTWLISQKAANGDDADFSPADIVNIDNRFHTTDISQEFIYDGKASFDGLVSSVDYVAGAYYAHQQLDAEYQIFWGKQAQAYFNALLAPLGLPPGFAQAPYGRYDEELYGGRDNSYAGYTHWTAHIGDSLSVFAGIRYSLEEKEGSFHYGYIDKDPYAAFEVLGAAPGPAFNDTHNDSAVSGTVGIQYQLAPTAMTYVSYSRGFKAGGINLDRSAGGGVANNPAITPGAVPLNPVYQPEFIDGFEGGVKSEYFDQRFRTNVALFYDRITDLQVAQFLGLNYQVVNVPTATVAGAELENTARLNEDLTLNAALTLLPEANFGASPLIAENLHNRRFSQAPREAATIGMDLNHPVSDHYALIGNVTEQVTSKVYIDTVTNTTQDIVPLLNASFGVKSLDHGWTLEAWCLNCTDKRYLSSAFGGPLQTGTELAFIAPPLTFGVRLRGTF